MRDALPKIVERAIGRHRLLRKRDSVLVAVSGGADSVALLAALVEIRAPGWRIGVCHVNHGLRGAASDRDQRFVERLAARLGCEVHVVSAKIVGRRNLEERARERRYAALARVATRRGFRRIATGHTLDDQAETVLHRMLRGTGTAGLAAIARDRGDGVIRPLLDVSRSEIVDFLRRRGLRHRVDRSNATIRFTRNRLRHRVLPLLEREVNPAAKRALARLADLAREDERWIDRAVARRARGTSRDGTLGLAALRTAPTALRRRLLRRWLGEARGSLRGIGLDHVDRLDALTSGSGDGRSLSLPGGTVARRRNRLSWNVASRTRRPYVRDLALGQSVQAGDWHIEARLSAEPVVPSRWRAVFDAARLDGRLRVRSAKTGDRIRPLGLGGSKKLQDVFVDAKVPRTERLGWPVVEEGTGAILWVPGLSRSDAAPMAGGSERFLVVEARRRPAKRF
jgi:tRNA(Ile)-lysidine synthase